MDPQSPLLSSLSVEENLLVRTGCRLLEFDTKQGPMAFWGKVFGTQNDYYVLQSTTLHPFRVPLTYYSRDARIWQMLPQAGAALRKKAPRLSGMFTGDPSFTSHFVEYRYAGESYYEPTTTPVKEEERLAYLVHSIDNEGVIFPKGSVGLNEKGFLVKNPTYSGMSFDQCHDLHNFVVYKPSAQSGSAKPPDVGIADPDYRFLRPLSETQPADPSVFGTWLFRDALETQCVLLENALWPGLFFWHSIHTAHYGRCYIGRGDKEIDVPFILGNKYDQELVVDVGIFPDYDYKAPPVEALREAEDVFLADEERRDKLLPPLPVKEEGTEEGDGVSRGETEETSGGGDTTEQEVTEGETTSAEVTDASEAEGEEAEA